MSCVGTKGFSVRVMHGMKLLAAPLDLGHCFLELKSWVPWLEANSKNR